MMTRIKDFLFQDLSQQQQRWIGWLWRLAFLAVGLVVLAFTLVSFSDLPSVTELENPKNNEASQVIATDGSLLGRYYTENRVMVDFQDLGQHIPKALVATEDERFYSHSGIDWKALGRAIIKTGILGQSSSGGGSTITQQLAKLLFTEGGRSRAASRAIVQKMKEWIIAVRLERKYTKEEIMAMYLNRYDFINGAQGIRAAAENYFGKKPHELELQEAATLVGMLKNASLYNPLRNAEGVVNRRNVVLSQMVRNKMLGKEQYAQLKAMPLGLSYTRQSHDDGLAPYFRMVLAEEIKTLLQQPQHQKANGQTYDIYRDGLTIYTTLDPQLQAHAETVARQHMAKIQKEFYRHWRNENPWTHSSAYSSTEVDVAVRKNALNKEIRKTQRYQNLRQKYLVPAIEKISEKNKLPFNTDDREVERMVRETEESGYLEKLIGPLGISRELAKQYRQVMKLSEFAELKKAWQKLQEEVKKEFDKPVNMRIFTYENERMEKDSTMSPMDSIYYHNMVLQIGSMSVEPSTGFVRTWVGGSSFKWFQFDHVTTKRQVGSTFKPFLYAATIDLRGMSPCFQVMDLPVTISPGDGSFRLQKPWTPRNSSDSYTGASLTLMQGLAQSKNTVSAFLMRELGSTDPVRTVIESMGIPKTEIPDAPSIALGSVDLTVQQMTGAYTAFANNGIFNRPVFLLRIEDRSGRTIYEYIPEQKRALSPQANYVMVHMLKNASVGGLHKIKGPLGGKTGTTNDFTDGWFMGLTPKLVVGTWVGGKDRWIRFRTSTYGYGAYLARPYFRDFVTSAQADENIEWDTQKDFYRPKGDIGIELDCARYGGGDALDAATDEEGNILGNDPFGGGINNTPDF